MKNVHLRESIALLGTKRFGTFWFASLLSNIGTWAQQMAQPWLLLSLGASPFLLGLDAFALGAPALMLILVGGALADRADRRRTIAFFQSIQMLCPLILVWLLITGSVEPWIVIVLSLIVGITGSTSVMLAKGWNSQGGLSELIYRLSIGYPAACIVVFLVFPYLIPKLTAALDKRLK